MVLMLMLHSLFVAPEQVNFRLIQLSQPTKRTRKFLLFHGPQPVPIIAHRVISMIAGNSAIVRILEAAQDLLARALNAAK